MVFNFWVEWVWSGWGYLGARILSFILGVYRVNLVGEIRGSDIYWGYLSVRYFLFYLWLYYKNRSGIF